MQFEKQEIEEQQRLRVSETNDLREKQLQTAKRLEEQSKMIELMEHTKYDLIKITQ